MASTLTITQNAEGDFVIDGDGYDPDSLVYVEQGTYRPTDGTRGRNFGHALFASTDENGHFSVTWPKMMVVGNNHTPGEFDLTTVGSPATATGAVT